MFFQIFLVQKRRDTAQFYTYISLISKPSGQSSHSRGNLSASLITLMPGNTNGLTWAAISPDSFLQLLQDKDASRKHVSPTCQFIPHCYQSESSDWLMHGSFHAGKFQSKETPLRCECPWITSYYLSFSLEALEPLTRIRGEDKKSSAVVWSSAILC